MFRQKEREKFEPKHFFLIARNMGREKDSCVNRDQGSRHPPKHIPILQREGGHHICTTGAKFVQTVQDHFDSMPGILVWPEIRPPISQYKYSQDRTVAAKQSQSQRVYDKFNMLYLLKRLI